MAYRHSLLKLILVSSAALLSSMTAQAGCISITQQPVVDPNFNPLTLQFNVHVTSMLNGVNNSAVVDQSFIENLTINQTFQQTTDNCNSNTSILSNSAVSAPTANTTDISNHAGKDFSLVPNQVVLMAQDSGYVTIQDLGGSLTVPAYQSSFNVTANSYSPIWNNTLNQYTYANYTRGISFIESGLQGSYLQQLDLTSYLLSNIGTSGSYNDFVTITNQNYQTMDIYGYLGTATLINVTAAVPEPSEWLLMLCGFFLVGHIATRRKGISFNMMLANINNTTHKDTEG
jgi:hypothetical protein